METTPQADGRSMRERMLAGDLYLADDPEIAEAAAVSHDLMAAYSSTTARQGPLRRELLARRAARRILDAVGVRGCVDRRGQLAQASRGAEASPGPASLVGLLRRCAPPTMRSASSSVS
jgi:hypothetical protein